MNSNLTSEEISKLRNVSIFEILGIPNRGRRVSVRCPFHSERTPSFILYPTNDFHCFGCGKNGQGAIDFCMGFDISFLDACEELVKYVK